MSKYVYYNGKIYTKTINAYNQTLYCNKNDTYYFADVKYLCGYYVEFDNFEDLIKVGDLIIVTEIGMINSKTVHYVWKITSECFRTSLGKLIKGFSNMEINNIEILKHINDDYIRICHKKNNEWVID